MTTGIPAWADHAATSHALRPYQASHLARLANALGPTAPNDDELKLLIWLAGWDQPTVAAIANLITRCRKEG